MTVKFNPTVYRCNECYTTFVSKYPGDYVSCQCGKCAVDETIGYTRHIGGERTVVKEETK